jgi:hypothetical protein
VIDSFTRAVGLYAVPDTTAQQETTRKMIQHIRVFGCPQRIISDRDTQFITSDLFKELVSLLGVDHVSVHPGSKQEVRQVENANSYYLEI